jgi:hypothetical protein
MILELEDINTVFDSMAYYYNCILNEHGINAQFSNPTYTASALSSELNYFSFKCK